MSYKMLKRNLYQLYVLLAPIIDPIRILRGVVAYLRYVRQWRAYRDLPDAEPLHLKNANPQLYDRTATTGVDAHYFYANGWAMRRIIAHAPPRHVDIGSHAVFVNLLSAVVPVTFVDYRPLEASLPGLTSQAGNILALPFATDSLPSLSCIHVAEHIGLGRYGDPLDPAGTRKACAELARVLARGGNLYFALPVGIERVCFNAHRVHDPATILDYFDELELVEFSAVDDNGCYIEGIDPASLRRSHYACGLFWLRKPQA